MRNWLNRLTVLDSVAEIEGDKLAGIDAACDFDLATVVVAQGDRDQMQTITLHDRGVNAAVAEDKCVIRASRCLVTRRDVEVDGRVHSGIQSGVGVRKIHFDTHGSSIRVERVGMARDRTDEFAAGILCHRYGGWVPIPDERGQILRHVRVDPQRMKVANSSSGVLLPGEVACGINAPASTYRAVMTPSV